MSGVKGMKWGVRKDRGHEGEQTKTKTIAKLDKKFDNSLNMNTWVKVHNRAAQLTNDHDIARINNKPQYKGVDFSRNTPLRQKYYKEHQDAFLKNVEKAADELGTNASGTKKYNIIEDDIGNWAITIKDIEHADDVIRVKVTYDSNGVITNVKVVDAIVHADDFVDNFLEHHGVKGMRWGVKGGKGTPRKTSGDHKTAASLRKKRASELSNKQLQKANARANLERNYRNLNPSKVQKGHDVVKSILAIGGTAIAVHQMVNSPAGKAAVAFVKNNVKVAVKVKYAK